MKSMSVADAEQLVVTEMDKDSAKRLGVRTIKAKVARNAGQILPRYEILTLIYLQTVNRPQVHLYPK